MSGSETSAGGVAGYLASCRSSRMLVHGVVLQVAAVLITYVSSTFMPDGRAGDLEPMQRLLQAGQLMALAASIVSLAGWAMVIFACGKVVAESVQGNER